MNEITQIRKLSLWIFLVPLFGINLCLIIAQNPQLLENTIFEVDQIGISGFSIPYFDGGLSISRAARTYPQFLVFKPAMWLTAFLLYFYWTKNNQIVNLLNATNINYRFRIFGILSAILLAIHSLFLGIKFEIEVYKLFRRVVLLLFIIFEIIAQGILVYHFLKLKHKIERFINKNILKLKLFLVAILATVGVLSLPILLTSGNTQFKHALEWNYFVGVVCFYLLSKLFWRRTT